MRDTRRIAGEYVLTFADSQSSREFPDTIARKYGAIDANQLFIGTMDSGFAYPYRSLVPQAVDGLLLAGRCASATFLGHSAAPQARRRHCAPRRISSRARSTRRCCVKPCRKNSARSSREVAA